MKAADHPALKLFSELLAVPSPPGREERVAEIVRTHLSGMGYEHETDPAGNVLVRIDGADPEAPLAVLGAHMDEIAMVVVRIEPDGSLRMTNSGGLIPFKMGEGPVTIVGDGDATVTGVLSMGSTHAKGAADRSPGWDDVKVITGLAPDELSARGVRVGSSAVPVREGRGPFVLGDDADPLVAAWTFDDRMGVVGLLRLLERMKADGITPPRPLIVAFTVHEEGGCHGAKVLCHREMPEIFVAVDGCPIPPGCPLEIDGRPGTWSKDADTNYDQRLVVQICEAARAALTEMQVAVYTGAASDAGRVYAVGGAPRVAFIGHVRENSHGYEVARLSVFDNVLETLVEFVRII